MVKLINLTLIFLLLINTTQAQPNDVENYFEEKILESEILQKERKYQEALDILLPLLEEFPDTSLIPPASLAWIYHKIGWNKYNQRDYDSALDFTNRAVQLRHSVLVKNHPELANSLFNRGAIYWAKGDLTKAQEDMLVAIEVSGKSSLLTQEQRDSSAGHYYPYLAMITIHKRDHKRAMLYLETALSYNLKRHGPDHYSMGDYYYTMGAAEVNMENFKPALKLFQQALKVYLKSEDVALNEIARCYNGIGWAYSRLGQYEKAINPYKKAIQYNIRGNDKSVLGEMHANLMEGYIEIGQLDLAKKAFEEGMAFALPIRKPEDLAQLHWRKSELEQVKGNYELALSHSNQAIQWHIPDFEPRANTDLPIFDQNHIRGERAELLDILMAKAKVLSNLAEEQNNNKLQLEAALEVYLFCDTLVNHIRLANLTTESRYAFNRQLIDLYENAIQVALALHKENNNEGYLTLAYELAARNKAVVLLEGIQDQEAKVFAKIPKEILAQESELIQEFYDLERRIANLVDKENLSQLDSLKLRRMTVQGQYEKLIDQLEVDYPDYHKMKYKVLESSKVSYLQERRPKDAAIVEFFIGKQSIYTFILDEQGLRCFSKVKPKEFDASCNAFRAKLEVTTMTETQTQDFFSVGHQLYGWLLKTPLESLSSQINRLILIPDDLLLQLSFDLFLTAAPKSNTTFFDQALLLKQYALSYAYSNQLVFAPNQQVLVSDQNRNFAGFGLEYEASTLRSLNELDSVGKFRNLVLASRAMGPLIYADDEVIEIAELIGGGATWVNRAATKDSYLEEAGKYSILHLAMHSLVDVEYPMNSSLIFSKPPDSDDFLLYAFEIYNQNLDSVEMVVLSACNTGYGTLNQGEGLRSLSRAFAFAGSPSLIASLWNAADKSTKDIMISFYKYLKKGYTKDAALQAAKLEYLKEANPEFTRPHYWAHLIATGEMRSLPFIVKKRRTWFWLIGGISILMLLFFWYKSRN